MRVVLLDDLPDTGLHRDTTTSASEYVKGKLVERVELRRVGPACHGRIIGRADIYTHGGGLVHALLVALQDEFGDEGLGLRLVYLDRQINAFVSIGVER